MPDLSIGIPLALAERLLAFQYKDSPGYGRLACRSCGALAFHDYELQKVDREPCSKNCPFFQLEQAILAVKYPSAADGKHD